MWKCRIKIVNSDHVAKQARNGEKSENKGKMTRAALRGGKKLQHELSRRVQGEKFN